jgi:hypothetical protein
MKHIISILIEVKTIDPKTVDPIYDPKFVRGIAGLTKEEQERALAGNMSDDETAELAGETDWSQTAVADEDEL